MFEGLDAKADRELFTRDREDIDFIEVTKFSTEGWPEVRKDMLDSYDLDCEE